MICPKCGSQINDNARFCGVCGWQIVQQQPYSNYQPSYTPNPFVRSDPYQNDPNPIQNYPVPSANLVLANGETLVKTYEIASLRALRTTGYLSVTTKRVIFHAESGSDSFISKEIWLDKVTGLDILTGRNLSIGKLILAIIFLIAGFALIGNIWYVGLGLILIAAFLAYKSIKRTYSFAVYGSNSSPSAIDIGEGATSFIGNHAVSAIACIPTRETFKAVREAGALILDLQTRGELAVKDWIAR